MNSKTVVFVALCITATLLISAIAYDDDNETSSEQTYTYDEENGAFYKFIPMDVMILGIGDVADELNRCLEMYNYRIAYSDDYELSFGYDIVFLTQDWVNDNFDKNLVAVGEMLDSGSIVSAYNCNPGWMDFGPNIPITSVESIHRVNDNDIWNIEKEKDSKSNLIATVSWAIDTKILGDKVLNLGILGTDGDAGHLKELLQSERTVVTIGDVDDLRECDMLFITQSWMNMKGPHTQSTVRDLVNDGYIVSSYECYPSWETMGISVSYSPSSQFNSVYLSDTCTSCFSIECNSMKEAADSTVAWAFYTLFYKSLDE